MKRILISFFGVVCLTIAMSSAVLAKPGQGKGGPPINPGGVCAIVVGLPMPGSVRATLLALFECPCFPPDPCGGGGGD